MSTCEELLRLAFVKEHIGIARWCLSEIITDERQRYFEKILDGGRIESPIEAVFLVYWRMLRTIGGSSPERALNLVEQYQVEIGSDRFRLDFAILPADPLIQQFAEHLGYPMKVAVELDGHEFHERTKEQVTIRDRRDRILQVDGWKVLHVSGSELARRQGELVADIYVVAEGELAAMRRRLARDWGLVEEYQ